VVYNGDGERGHSGFGGWMPKDRSVSASSGAGGKKKSPINWGWWIILVSLLAGLGYYWFGR
jgi:hypothetical protein